MGEDFNYQDANMWFKNLDKLIKWDTFLSIFSFGMQTCYIPNFVERIFANTSFTTADTPTKLNRMDQTSTWYTLHRVAIWRLFMTPI